MLVSDRQINNCLYRDNLMDSYQAQGNKRATLRSPSVISGKFSIAYAATTVRSRTGTRTGIFFNAA
jgi:hypothetical protein